MIYFFIDIYIYDIESRVYIEAITHAMCVVYSTLYRWTCGHMNEPRSVLVQGLTSETRLPQLCGQLRALLTALVGHLPQAH